MMKKLQTTQQGDEVEVVVEEAKWSVAQTYADWAQ